MHAEAFSISLSPDELEKSLSLVPYLPPPLIAALNTFKDEHDKQPSQLEHDVELQNLNTENTNEVPEDSMSTPTSLIVQDTELDEEPHEDEIIGFYKIALLEKYAELKHFYTKIGLLANHLLNYKSLSVFMLKLDPNNAWDELDADFELSPEQCEGRKISITELAFLLTLLRINNDTRSKYKIQILRAKQEFVEELKQQQYAKKEAERKAEEDFRRDSQMLHNGDQSEDIEIPVDEIKRSYFKQQRTRKKRVPHFKKKITRNPYVKMLADRVR